MNATFLLPHSKMLSNQQREKSLLKRTKLEESWLFQRCWLMLKVWVKDLTKVSFQLNLNWHRELTSTLEVEGFFNLLFAHLFALHSSSSPELKQYIISLLKMLSSSSERLSVRYRMYVPVYLHLLEPFKKKKSHLVYQIYSMPSLDHLRYDFLFTNPYLRLQLHTMILTSWDLQRKT